jgi:iron(III) transport system permease protein
VLGLLASLSVGVPMGVLLETVGSTDAVIAAWRTAHAQLWASGGIAAMSATWMVLLGLGLGWELAGQRLARRVWIDYATLLPIALPGTILGLGMIFLWNHPAAHLIYTTPAVVVVLHVSRFLPFVARTAAIGCGQVGQDLLDAARLAPASAGSRFRRIVLPLLAPSLLVGWTLGFVLSLHELAGTLLVTPPGVETLSVRIYSLYHYGANNMVAALSLFLIAGSLLTVGIVTGLCQWLKSSSSTLRFR